MKTFLRRPTKILQFPTHLGEFKKKSAHKKYEYVYLGSGTLNQLFIKGSYTQTLNLNFQKKLSKVSGKSLFFVIGPFCTPHSICLNIGF